MQITINGTTHELSADATVRDAVDAVLGDDQSEGLAVAVNGQVVPRSTWGSATLNAGDAVELVTAFAGG